MTVPFELHERPDLDEPVLVVMLQGWIDGNVVALAVQPLPCRRVVAVHDDGGVGDWQGHAQAIAAALRGGVVFCAFNHSYNKDPEIAKWIGNVDFRRALSLAIDRDELNQIFWLGIGQPRTIVPADDNPYNPGPEYSALWATHDPDKANAMLDRLGLTKKDSEGYRLPVDRMAAALTPHTTLVSLASPQNPYFASNFANRVWAHFFGLGIIDPVDDVRISNPASNPELLAEMAKRFTATTVRGEIAAS